MLEDCFERLAQIPGDSKHHFAAGLQGAAFQLGHIRTFHTDPARQVRLGDALCLPPSGDCVRYHAVAGHDRITQRLQGKRMLP